MTSTTSKGNTFRDTVCLLLKAAGYQNIRIEKPLPGKNVDIYAEMPGLVTERFAFETKDYGKSIDNGTANEFARDYGALIQRGEITTAILVSRGALTQSAVNAATTGNTAGMTFEDFQSSIFGGPSYLADMTSAHLEDPSREMYVPARISEGNLEGYVLGWMNQPHVRPLVVLGGYGSGKTTFASHLTGLLATKAAADPTQRIPVRIRLGDLTEQNNLEGLFGAHFTAQHSVRGYSWQLFQELNRLGRFLIIFDGFDEMKHGMTVSVFQKQFDRLLQLATGKAKILILGRDTAFLDDAEFRAVVKGRRTTANGAELPSFTRPECDHVKLLPFTQSEAHTFIDKYFRYLLVSEGRAVDAWAEGRLAELLSPRFDQLVRKPVHSQMLCRIATKPQWGLSDIDQFNLYDLFVEYLLMREVEKQGRFEEFGVRIRRTANASLSWWLFSQDAASTVSVASAPVSLFKRAVGQVSHEFDDEALVRELAQGCLVEKGADVVYFGHRSIQEFLAAEHLYEMRLAPDLDGTNVPGVCRWATEEVCGFLEVYFARRPDSRDVADAAVGTFLNHVGPVDLDRLTPYEVAFRHSSYTATEMAGAGSVWLCWLARNKISESFRTDERARSLLETIYNARGEEEYAAAVHLLYCAVLAGAPMQTGNAVAPLIAALVDVGELSAIVKASAGKRGITIASNSHLRTFALARSTTLRSHPVNDELMVELDIDAANQVARKVLGYLPYRSSISEPRGAPLLSAPMQAVMRALRGQRGESALSGGKEALVRQFFSREFRDKVSAVEVARSSRATPNIRSNGRERSQ